MSLDILLTQLRARMPELEWQLSKLGRSSYLNSCLPKGLFKVGSEEEVGAYIVEIKKDMYILEQQQDNERTALHLAQKIKQKIDSLVMLCHYKKNNTPIPEQKSFTIDTISTRQQWMQSLQSNIEILTEQKNAMVSVLQGMSKKPDQQKLLSLQGELGHIEKQLTLALAKYQEFL